jgi:hypothetical protein
MASKSKRTTSNSAADQLQKDAALLFKVINDPNIPDDARNEISGWADEIYNYADNIPDPHKDKRLFVRTFVDGMQNAPRAPASQHIRRIIKGLREGQEPAAIAAWFKQEQARIAAEQEEKRRTQPEPKDQTSAEWRYWKLGQFKLAFKSADTRRSAWREFHAMLKTLVKNPNFTVGDAMTLLPYIIVIQQRLDDEQTGGASDVK